MLPPLFLRLFALGIAPMLAAEPASSADPSARADLPRDLESVRNGRLSPEDVLSRYTLTVVKGWWYACLLGPKDSFYFTRSRRDQVCPPNLDVVAPTTYVSTVSSPGNPRYTTGPELLPSATYLARGWTVRMGGEALSQMDVLREAIHDGPWPSD